MKKCLSILLFHRVLDKFDPMRPSEPDIHRFDKQMRWVKRFFNVLDLSDAVNKLASNSLPPRALCITFDDGYRDNYQNALPILEKYGLTATFFIASGFLNDGIMWNDIVVEGLRNTKLKKIELDEYGLGSIDIHSDRVECLGSVLSKLKYLSFDQRAKVVADFPDILGVAKPGGLMMTTGQVKKLSHRGMTVGGHTVSHPILSRLDAKHALHEIERGKQTLEAIIDQKINLFAYPNGKPGQDYQQEHVDMMKQVNFDAAVSTAWGVATEASDPYQLPRFTPWDENIIKYLLRLAKMRYSSSELKV